MPSLRDWLIMSGLGFIWAGGMYLNARAYSEAPASVVAPFEYSTLPINVLWGIILWQQYPTRNTWAGAGIAIASGLYLLYANRTPAAARAATD
jgi:drug/metabolite transporter (DMT)-like permease